MGLSSPSGLVFTSLSHIKTLGFILFGGSIYFFPYPSPFLPSFFIVFILSCCSFVTQSILLLCITETNKQKTINRQTQKSRLVFVRFHCSVCNLGSKWCVLLVNVSAETFPLTKKNLKSVKTYGKLSLATITLPENNTAFTLQHTLLLLVEKMETVKGGWPWPQSPSSPVLQEVTFQAINYGWFRKKHMSM